MREESIYSWYIIRSEINWIRYYVWCKADSIGFTISFASRRRNAIDRVWKGIGGTYRLVGLCELDRIIWEDRIEISLRISRQGNFFLVGVFWLLPFSLDELSLALLLLIVNGEESVLIKEVKQNWRLEVGGGFSTRLAEKGGRRRLVTSWVVII